MGADFGAGLAAHAALLHHEGLAGVVHLHLPGPGTAAHADILQGAAHAGLLVGFEVGQADKHIRVHNGPADLGLLHVPVLNKKIAEYTKAVVAGRPCFHVALVLDISPNCDCHGENDAPIVPDVGMFASFGKLSINSQGTYGLVSMVFPLFRQLQILISS